MSEESIDTVNGPGTPTSPDETDTVATADSGDKSETSTEQPQQETPKSTVKLEASPIKDIFGTDSETKLDNTNSLSFLNLDLDEIETLSSQYSKLDGSSDAEGRAWLASFITGVEHLVKGSTFSAAVERGDSEWRQRIEAAGESLGPARPKFGSTEGGVISGEKAILKVTAALGLGANVQIPLWHTGIWVSIKAPTESSLLELERRCANEKINLGRSTSGMVFSNTSVYMVNHVLNFILNHVYDASVKNLTPEALKKVIKITDIPTLIWGMNCAIYPNGYNYQRPCTTDPSVCQHVVSGELNLAKLFWFDSACITDQQRRHMLKRTEKFTPEQLTAYEDQHSRGGMHTVTLNENLKVKLKVPTIGQYEQAGFNWIDGIVRMLEGAFGTSLNGSERDDYIRDQGSITALRQFSHWVDSIEAGDDRIADTDTLEQLLEAMSSNDGMSKKFYSEVGKFIDDSTIAVIAIPKYKCPKCGGDQGSDVHVEAHPHLLPIDTLKTFFTLLDQRVSKALLVSKL